MDVRRSGSSRPAIWFVGVDWLAIVLLSLLVQIPGLLHWIDSNPLPLISSLGTGGTPGLLPGFPGWIDPNIGATTQSLGHLAASSWLAGQVPWWNPYSGIGVPLAAEMQPAALFLPFVLLLRLHDGLLWLRVAMCAVGGLGAYELARALGLRRLACLAAGVLFAFNGTAAWLPHGPERAAAFLPLLLLGIERARSHAVEGRSLGWLWLAAGLAMSLYAGFPEVAYLDGLLAAAWSLWRVVAPGRADAPPLANPWAARRRLVGKIAAGLGVALLLSAPATLPFVLYVRHADLGGHAAGWFAHAALPPNAFPMFLIPYLYGSIEGFGIGGPHPVTSGAWGLIGGYVGAASCVLAILRLVGGPARDAGLRWVLAGWIAFCLAKTASLPGVTEAANLLPLLSKAAFFRYAEPSWELACVLLAAAAIDAWRAAPMPGARALLGGALGLVLIALSLYLAWPSLLALTGARGYPACLILAVEWAILVVVALPALLARPSRAWRRVAVLALVGLDAVAMFAVPLSSATQGAAVDRAPLDFLRAHLGLQRFYSMTAIPPNYGALFGLAQINDDMLPVPRLWADHIRAALDPLATPVTFSGSNGGRPPGPSARDMLLARLDAYRALGVRYVVTPRGEDSLDGEIATAPDVAGIPLQLMPGASAGGTLPAGFTQGRRLAEMRVTIGTYGGRADGSLAVRLCSQSACASGSAVLRGAADNAGLDVDLSPPLPTGPHEVLRFTVAHQGGTVPVALWMVPGSVARLDPAVWSAASGPTLVLTWRRSAAPIPRVFRDAHVDIFELPDPAPYVAASPRCTLDVVDRGTLVADCVAAATLTRRELAFPGWRAAVGDQPVPVGSDGLFQTVALPAGHSVVRFAYAPPFIGFAWAAACLGIVWVLLAAMGWRVRAGRAAARSTGARSTAARSTAARSTGARWPAAVDAVCATVDLRLGTAVLILAVVLCFWASERRVAAALPAMVSATISLTASADETVPVFVDEGHGFGASPAAIVGVQRSATPRPYRIFFRAVSLLRVRLDGAGLSSPSGMTLCCVGRSADGLALERMAEGAGPMLEFVAPSPLHLRGGARSAVWRIVSFGARCLTAALFAMLGWRMVREALGGPGRHRQPRAAIVAVAALAALASLYPVVFANSSLVSPGNGGNWLAYPSPPFVPGGPSSLQVADVRGADTGATAWQYRSYSVIQQAGLSHGELPLYNRYSSAGVSLVGQGTSQLGDPLHWLTVAAGGAGWAWDAKFFLAKLLLCAGTGFIVLLATGSPAAAMLLAGSVAFLGVFSFRLNHPAYFALCYAPWLWVGMALLTQPGVARRRATGFAILLLSAWMEMNTGAVKEGYVAVLLAFLSGGVMVLGLLAHGGRAYRPVLALLAAGVLIPLLTAPWWLSFLDALRHSVNYAPNQGVGQVPGLFLPLLVDNAFFAAVSNGQLGVPSANPLVVFAALAGLLSLPELLASPILMAAAVQAILCLAVAFAVVPAPVIAAIPLIGDIGHVADVFLLASLPPLALLAGHGCAMLTSDAPRWRRVGVAAAALLLFGAMIARYAIELGGDAYLRGTAFQPGLLVATACGLGLCIVGLLGGSAWRRERWGAVSLVVGLAAAHLAYGLHLRVFARASAQALTAPAQRVDFQTRSPGIEWARSLAREPYRVAGLDGFLFPGYNASLLIEGINGPEALIVPAYRELMQALGFEDSFHWGWLHLVHSGQVARLSRALDALNVQALVAGPGASPSKYGPAFVGAADLAVLRRPSAWPRAFFTDRVVRGDGGGAFASRLRSADGRPFAMIGAALHLPFVAADPAGGGGQVVAARAYRMTPGATALIVDAPGPGLLVLTETDLPGELQATLDGTAARPIRTNVAFQGYIIEQAGPHVLKVRFVASGWKLGLALGAIGVVGLLSLGVIVARFGAPWGDWRGPEPER